VKKQNTLIGWGDEGNRESIHPTDEKEKPARVNTQSVKSLDACTILPIY